MWSIAQRAKRHSSPFKRRGVGQAKDRRSTRGPARPDARRSTGGPASPGARQTSSDPKPDTTPLPLIWDVRIANLRQIDYPTLQPVAKSAFPELLSVRVDYVGNYLFIFLLVFLSLIFPHMCIIFRSKDIYPHVSSASRALSWPLYSVYSLLT